MQRTLNLIWLLILTSSFSIAQAEKIKSPVGNWLGLLDVGSTKLRVAFHITDSNGVLKTTMDSPDQGVRGIAATKTEFVQDTLRVAGVFGSFAGIMTNDSTINGLLFQGRKFLLILHRGELKEKPQTPVAPSPYNSEDVLYKDTATNITYGATITFPSDGKKHPAVLLVTGSGQQNRDEEILGHRPFLVIADFLTRNGYVVLRVDDRKMGQTTGSLDGITTKDFAADAAFSLDYLKRRKEVDPNKVGIIGHSEGGMIAQMLAADRSDIAFILSISGPGINVKSLMLEQNDAILKQNGFDDASRKAYLQLYSAIVDSTIRHDTTRPFANTIQQAVTSWRAKTPDSVVAKTTGITNELTQKRFVSAFAGQFGNEWSRFFLSYNPSPNIEKLQCKVLAINGEKDVQVLAHSNLQGWKTALEKSKSKSYQVLELPGLNHLLQECVTCEVSEYGSLEQTISPKALQTIGDWLKKEVN